jgi:serine/threonine-protein kinase
VSDVLAAVLRGEPDWAALPPATPGAVRRVLRRCLEKDPERRLHDMADARLEMNDVRAATDVDPQGATARPLAGRFLPWAVAAILGVVAALGWSGLWTRRAPQTRDLLHAAVMLPEDLDLSEGAPGVQILAISADAKRLVFAARREDMIQLYLRSLDSPDVVEIPGTVGAAMPFFSPDGTWIAFFVGGKLKKVAVQGGTPISLCDAPSPRGGTWIDDDTILLSPTFTSGLAVVSAAGGEPKLLTKPDPAKNERSHRWPTILPGRKAALFTIGTLDKPGDYEDAVIAVADLASGQSHTVVEGASMALFAPPDHLIYSRGGALFSVPFDPVGRRVTGSPATVLQGVAGDRSSGMVHFALAADGTLAYMPTGKGTRDGKLAWADREGRVEDLPSEPRLYRNLRLSPDGKRLALNIGPGPGDNDTWIYDFDRNALTRFTFDQASYHPLWTLDGRRIVFAATTGGHEGVAWKAADGSEERRMILSQSGIYTPAVCAWVPGHNELVFSRLGGHGGSDLLSIIPGETEAKTVLDTPYLEGGATFSPDGKWMAYCSNESGRLEIYVCAYPPTAGKWQISTSGGRGPCWSHDGREIFYTLGRKMMAVEVATIPTFAPGRPRQLFEFPFDRFIGAERDYDVTPDGRSFIFVRPQSPAPRQIDLVLGLSMKRRP